MAPLGRSLRGGATEVAQSYTYDRFGNLTEILTEREGESPETRTIGTNSSTNRLTVAGYDLSGNVTSWAGREYRYDPFNMLWQTKPTSGNGVSFVYGPGDERLWTIDWSAGSAPSNWLETWTLRDLNGIPLRQFRQQGGNGASSNWSFQRDYVYRGGALLAAHTPEGLHHFHLDHLGSPRIITDSSANTIAQHLYFPFGEEATNPTQNDEALKYTGHERDDLDAGGTTADLDYMHARYFSAHLGRFMSPDPVIRNTSNPQSWNRYSYVRDNPLKYVDPTGAIVSLTGLDDLEIQKLLRALYETTGNEYGVDSDGNLALVALGDESSPTATAIVESLINDNRTFEVEACNGCGIHFAGADLTAERIHVDFADFQHVNYGKVTPGSFSLGSQFLYEGLHLLNPNLTDPSQRGERGFFVDMVNQVRKERGLDLRNEYLGLRNYGEVTVFFEARGWRRAFGLRNKVTYPHDAVARGPAPPQ